LFPSEALSWLYVQLLAVILTGFREGKSLFIRAGAHDADIDIVYERLVAVVLALVVERVEPRYVAIFPGDETVETDRDIEDDTRCWPLH
jgi:hypothetical protein